MTEITIRFAVRDGAHESIGKLVDQIEGSIIEHMATLNLFLMPRNGRHSIIVETEKA